MLRQRVITALIMLAVLVAALWSTSPTPFFALALAMMAARALADSGPMSIPGCRSSWAAGPLSKASASAVRSNRIGTLL